MQFQRINQATDKITDKFISYCLKSKPYDFCHLPSRTASIIKIKEYIEFLFQICEVYLGMIDDQIKLFVAVRRDNQNLEIEFIFGDHFGFLENFKKFRLFFSDSYPEIRTFRAQITRKYKLKHFMNFLSKKDPNIQIILDNQEIVVLWNT